MPHIHTTLHCNKLIVYPLPPLPQLVLEDELAADDSTDTVDLQITPSSSTALLLNNNGLTLWEGFSDALSRLFVDHSSHLCWLDLAINEIRTIDAVSY